MNMEKEGVRKNKFALVGGVASLVLIFSGIALAMYVETPETQDNIESSCESSVVSTCESPIVKSCETPIASATYSELQVKVKQHLNPNIIVDAYTPIGSDTASSIFVESSKEKTAKKEVTKKTTKSKKSKNSKKAKKKKQSKKSNDYTWNGPVLNSFAGIVAGPSGNETYYNLDMSGVISIMQSCGYNYTYWVRDDGVKMYGDYVMVAADLSIRPRGSIVPTSLGLGIVCDTGGFVNWDNTRLDIATTW